MGNIDEYSQEEEKAGKRMSLFLNKGFEETQIWETQIKTAIDSWKRWPGKKVKGQGQIWIWESSFYDYIVIHRSSVFIIWHEA